MMFFLLKLDNHNLKHFIGLIVVCTFVTLIYFLNKFFFNKYNLEPPKLIQINKHLLKSMAIGLLLALIILFPTRIIQFLQTDNIDYLIVVFTLENFKNALFASITEEIIFRGTLLNFYSQKKKKYLGLIISSLIFGLLHIANVLDGQEVSFIYIFYIVLYGFCFGLTYLNFGIIGSITFHFIGNLLITGFEKSTNDFFNSSDFYYKLILTFIVCILLFYRDRKKSLNSN